MGMILPNGYEMKSTFWMDYSIADRFGKEAVQDTFERSRHWLETDYEMFIEQIIVFSNKSFEHYKRNPELCEMYSELYYKARDMFFDEYDKNTDAGKKAMRRFYEITD